MGLQKTPQPEEVGATAAEPAAPAPTPPKREAATAPAAPKKAEGKTLNLLAVKRPISDPTTGVEYDLNVPRPGVVKEGNWLHCQIVVGILKEWTPPGTPEIEA